MPAVSGKAAIISDVKQDPRHFPDVDLMAGYKTKDMITLPLKQWEEKKPTLSPQHLLKNAAASYSQNERGELANLEIDKFTWDPAAVCP